ncbi:sensor domain-containing protein [Evansella halocellulosilytica]|uniref:sensor domain-containing protein n=1 Tax=Evansella halocellulosilytica TaxID=2011013 RepID=UPI000BB894ED|nr:GGDEF domain-containing phosphodiesterase [Evansella halocellulosilytica]
MFKSFVTLNGRVEEFRQHLLSEQRTLTHETEEMLNQLGELLQVIDEACALVITDQHGVLIEVSDNFCKLSGYSQEELIGKHVRIVNSGYHPPDFFQKMWKKIQNGDIWSGEVKNKRKDNTDFWVQLTILPICDHSGKPKKFISVSKDITDGRMVENRVRKLLEEDYATIIKHMQNCVFKLRLTNEEQQSHVISMIEGRLLEQLGLNGDEAEGKEITDVFGDESEHVMMMKRLQKCFQGHTVHFDFKHRTRFLHATMSPVNENGQIVEVIASINDVTELKRSEIAVRNMAYHDSLTGLPNRRLLEEQLVYQLLDAQIENKRAALLLLDLDEFKNINDTLGHSVGDRFIMMIAERMQHLNLSLLTEKSKLYHLGGDEFVWLLYGFSEIDLIKSVQKVLSVLDEPFHYKGGEFYQRGSLGVSIYPNSAAYAEELMKHADMALYEAKQAGGQSYCFFSSDMKGNFLSKVQLENELRQAVKSNDQFQLYYQPIIEGKGKEIVSCEALIRWIHPVNGMVSPLQFIKIAEETGLIIPIGEWVIKQTCRDLKRWDEYGIERMKVSINISAYQLQQSDFVRRLKQIVDSEQVEPRRLQLEITENSLMENTIDSIRTLSKLRDLGFTLAIDDFGTGYSSLSYLKQFPVHCLKVDQSFIKDLPGDRADRAIVSSTMQLGKDLGLEMIAEGVELEEAYEYLQSIECPFMQGYYFDKPMPVENFLEKYVLCQRNANPVN